MNTAEAINNKNARPGESMRQLVSAPHRAIAYLNITIHFSPAKKKLDSTRITPSTAPLQLR